MSLEVDNKEHLKVNFENNTSPFNPKKVAGGLLLGAIATLSVYLIEKSSGGVLSQSVSTTTALVEDYFGFCATQNCNDAFTFETNCCALSNLNEFKNCLDKLENLTDNPRFNSIANQVVSFVQDRITNLLTGHCCKNQPTTDLSKNN